MSLVLRVINNFKWVIVAAVILVILCTQVFQFTIVPSNSMYPVAGTGSIVIGLRHAEVKRGDVVVFDYGKVRLIKRIIADEENTIYFRDGNMYWNGDYSETPTAVGKTEPLSSRTFYKIPKGCFFMMGDNRENSVDSRLWKNPYVKKSWVKSKSVVSINFKSKPIVQLL